MQKHTIIRFLVFAIVFGWHLAGPLAQPVRGAVRVEAVDAVGMTVSDMERSQAFYTNVLSFEPVSDVEVAGDAYEHLQGVFGLRLRVVRLQLGDESIVLSEYLAPKGGPFQSMPAVTIAGFSISPLLSATWIAPISGCAGIVSRLRHATGGKVRREGSITCIFCLAAASYR